MAEFRDKPFFSTAVKGPQPWSEVRDGGGLVAREGSTTRQNWWCLLVCANSRSAARNTNVTGLRADETRLYHYNKTSSVDE